MKTNPLETEKIEKLLIRFCIPALASNLVTALYNIVDQIFIGHVLGVVGNAATNVVFPAVTLISALSLMCGVGSSNAMNLHRGNGELEEARACVGGGLGLMILCGLLVTVPMLLWTKSLLIYPNGDAVCAGIRKDNSTFLCMCNYWSGRNFSHTCRWITEFFSCMHCDGIVGECCAGFFVHILLWMGNPGSSLGDLPGGNSQCGHSFVVFAVPLSGI